MSETCELVSFQNTLSTIVLVLITTIAILVTDASIVIGLVGSICGSATIYVLPCILYDRAMAMYMDEKGEMKHPEERYLVRMIACVGLFLMVGGATATLTL